MAVPYVPQKGDNNWDVGLGQSLEWLNAKIDTTATNAGKLSLVNAPSSPTSAGVTGTMAFSGNYLYLCIGDNAWVRFAKDGAW